MSGVKYPFPCTGCGACCCNLSSQPLAVHLDRGDGVCKYFNEKKSLCNIYEKRPIFCRVEDYYKMCLQEQFDWEEFVKINIKICQQLQSQYSHQKIPVVEIDTNKMNR